MAFVTSLKTALRQGELNEKTYHSVLELYESYAASVELSGLNMKEYEPIFESLLMLVIKHLKEPFRFESYHQKLQHPYDYFRFGIEFVRPLVITEQSHNVGVENLKKISEQLRLGENVILFANHQTEVDPQLMSIALETSFPEIGENVIFVAGDRVLTDPVAVPFSMGRNLLCIYSKRHIDHPPEKKEEKLQHNQRTMHRMKELLSEGGKCIYVAPSGGRDRKNAQGEVVVADFDPQSIEMFRLMAKQAHQPVHFYPLSLATFDILPPPPSVESELGEIRSAKRDGIQFFFGDEIEMDHFPGADLTDRHEKRSARARFIYSLVNTNYHRLKQGEFS